MTERCCATCVFCDAKNPADVFCRRYPPALVVLRDQMEQDAVKLFYPNVSPQRDWCGEHRTSPKKRVAR